MNNLTNLVNRMLGINQAFDQLLDAGDIDAVKARMDSHEKEAKEALEEYNFEDHKVNKRENKIVYDKKGNVKNIEEMNKIPVTYEQYANEMALVFLFGRPLKWAQTSERTDDAFKAYTDLIKSTHFNARVREFKRFAGSETESAMLFRLYRDEDGQAKCQIRVLAKSRGDEIYTRFDQYNDLKAFAWGYHTKEADDATKYHLDIHTPKTIYHCTQGKLGWEIEKENNPVGKILVIYARQTLEWHGAKAIRERIENTAATTADTNDYVASPIMIMNTDVIKNMPQKGEPGKMLITNSQTGVDGVAKYLTWDNAPQSKKDEMEWLESQFMQKTFTPNLTFDALKAISQMSAKAMKMFMLLGVIKAQKRKETYDELMDRTASLMISIIGNVLDVSLARQCKELKVDHEWQEPFEEDIKESIFNLIGSVDGGIMSRETAVSLNPLIKDPSGELDRIDEEREKAVQQQMEIYKGEQGDNREDEEREEE